MRVEQGDGWTLYCGEANEIVPTFAPASFDAIVTDPPYGTTSQETSFVNKNGIGIPRETQFYAAWWREQFSLWERVLKPTGAIWMTIDWRGAMIVDEVATRRGWKSPGVGVWHRRGLGMGYVMRNVYECFVILPMKGWRPRLRAEPNLWEITWTSGHRKHGHSAEKPVELMTRALHLVATPGAVILDPFAGSGSTLVAAREAGYEVIGIEREHMFVDIAVRRIEAAAAQRRLNLEQAG